VECKKSAGLFDVVLPDLLKEGHRSASELGTWHLNGGFVKGQHREHLQLAQP
jgi:hypothetical protein